jgi:hypothetical protein
MALRHRAVVEFAYMSAGTRIGGALEQLFGWQEAKMKIIAKVTEIAEDHGVIGKRTALLIFLVATTVSGCAVLSNSAKFYQDRRPGPINWRQYTSD